MPWIKLCFAGLLTFGMIGCQPSEQPTPSPVADDHDHDHGHSHPTTYAAAVTMLGDLSKAIETAFTSGQPGDAHDALHEVGHVLEDLPTLAAEAGVSDEAKASVAQASEALLDAYGKLDAGMHGGEEASYDDVKSDISVGMETLRSYNGTQE